MQSLHSRGCQAITAVEAGEPYRCNREATGQCPNCRKHLCDTHVRFCCLDERNDAELREQCRRLIRRLLEVTEVHEGTDEELCRELKEANATLEETKQRLHEVSNE